MTEGCFCDSAGESAGESKDVLPLLELLLCLLDLLLGKSLVLLGNLLSLEEEGLEEGVNLSGTPENTKEENETKFDLW